MSLKKADRVKGIFHLWGQAHRPLGVRMLLKAWLRPLFLRKGGNMTLGERLIGMLGGRFEEEYEKLDDYGIHLETGITDEMLSLGDNFLELKNVDDDINVRPD